MASTDPIRYDTSNRTRHSSIYKQIVRNVTNWMENIFEKIRMGILIAGLRFADDLLYVNMHIPLSFKHLTFCGLKQLAAYFSLV